MANQVLEIIWIVWLMSWVAASFWSDRAQKRAPTLETRIYRAAMIAGGILLAPWTGQLLEEKPIWKVSYVGVYVLAAVMLAGLSLTWWARIYLGPLWSSVITRKKDHRIIDTGPYAFVRHPIYCGLIIALLATAVAEGKATALLDRGYGRPAQSLDLHLSADAITKRLSDMTDAELAALEARMITLRREAHSRYELRGS